MWNWCWVCKVNGSFWSTSKFWDSYKVVDSYHILNSNKQKKLQQDDQFFLSTCIFEKPWENNKWSPYLFEKMHCLSKKQHTHILYFLHNWSKTPIRLLFVCIWRFFQHLSMWWNVQWRKLYACSETQNIHDYCYCDDISVISG